MEKYWIFGWIVLEFLENPKRCSWPYLPKVWSQSWHWNCFPIWCWTLLCRERLPLDLNSALHSKHLNNLIFISRVTSSDHLLCRAWLCAEWGIQLHKLMIFSCEKNSPNNTFVSRKCFWEISFLSLPKFWVFVSTFEFFPLYLYEQQISPRK